MTRPFLSKIIGMTIATLMVAIGTNILYYMMKVIADTATLHTSSDISKSLLTAMTQYIIVDFLIGFMYRVFEFYRLQFVPAQKAYITNYITQRMLLHSTSFYKKNFVGSIASKINYTLLIPEVVERFISRILACFFGTIFMCYCMWRVDYIFVIALLSWVFIFIGGSTTLLFKKKHIASAESEARAKVFGQIIDLLSHTSIVSLFSRKSYERNRLKKSTSDLVKKEKQKEWFLFTIYSLQSLSFVFYQIVCAIWLLDGMSKGTITTGDFILVFTINLSAIKQFWDISDEIRKIWEKLINVLQAIKSINLPVDVTDPLNAKALKVTKGEIIFDHVSFFYPGTTPLFENKSIVINSKQKVGLVGYSGSGKSTFINLILRLYDVKSGKILIDGQNITDVKQESLHNMISVIPQDLSLFNRSIMENIRYGRLDATNSEIKEVAKRAYVHEVIERLPQKYNTIVGEKGGRLSGGQRQLIAVARAMIKNAPILVLDEATSNLDLITEKKLQQSFFEIMKEKTVMVVAHRLSTLLFMDRILVFDRGNIVQDGTHMDLLAQDGLYRDLWNTQNKGFLPKVNRKSG